MGSLILCRLPRVYMGLKAVQSQRPLLSRQSPNAEPLGLGVTDLEDDHQTTGPVTCNSHNHYMLLGARPAAEEGRLHALHLPISPMEVPLEALRDEVSQPTVDGPLIMPHGMYHPLAANQP